MSAGPAIFFERLGIPAMISRRRAARFNRKFANHIVGRVMPLFPGFGVVCHRGRTSGRPYRTPVKVFRSGQSYLFSLPYGTEADWVRNVRAAGNCDLEIGRQRVRLTMPQVHVDPAPPEIPMVFRFVRRRLHTTALLTMEPAEIADLAAVRLRQAP